MRDSLSKILWSCPLIVLYGLSVPADAQPVLSARLENIRQITPSADYRSAVWSPTERGLLAFTSNKGTFIHREDSGENRLLTSHVAGFKYVWTSDGRSLVYRSRTNERTLTIESIDVQTGEKSLLDQSPDLGLPQEVGRGLIQYRKDRSFEKTVAKEPRGAAARRPYAYQDQDDIFVLADGAVTRISPYKGRFFLPQVSPDGSKVLYEELSGGMLVTDLSSGKTVSLGKGDDPVWLPDSRRVVFEITEDDDYSIVQSDLYIVDLQGRRSRLTATANQIEMRPSVSPDGKQVAFDSNGAIFVADLVLEEE